MLILSLDSAAAGCTVALLQDGAVLQCRQENMARGQDSRLLPMIEEMLAATEMSFAALDRIAVLRGPGSFTGIRIGLAAARGLGLALGKPVIGIDRFELYRQALGSGLPLLTVIDSRRSEAFCCLHEDAAKGKVFLAEAAHLALYDKKTIRICGDAARIYPWREASIVSLPEAEAVVAGRMAATLTPADHPPLPLYLRPPDVSHGPKPAVEEAPW